MKMHRLDYVEMERAINTRFTAADRVAIWSRYVARDLSARRFRWDLLHASGFNFTSLYQYGINDNHIDTALRRIIPIREESNGGQN